MEIINRKARMSSLVRKLRKENKVIGFVPTMGALHQGHLSLVQEARRMSDIVVVSIFVNPTQFGKNEDFDKYPRDLTSDAALLSSYNVDYIFAPSREEIYPEGFSTFVNVEGISESLEGEIRPGHFRGVATVVTILLNTVRPEFAFFGQKDAQQVAVVKRLAKDLGFDAQIMVMPIIREENGLAMSSRNAYLSEEERSKAGIIFKALSTAKSAYTEGERNPVWLTEIVRQKLAEEPLLTIDYIATVDAETLKPLDKIGEKDVLVAVAVRLGKVRLIDNVVLSRKQ